MVVDLTNTTRFYDAAEWSEFGDIQYVKVLARCSAVSEGMKPCRAAVEKSQETAEPDCVIQSLALVLRS